MIPVVVSQDWDEIRERAQTDPRDSSSREVSCAPRVRGCAARASSCARTGAAGCAAGGNRLRRLGWRKWCLFSFNLFLLSLVMLNFGITLWLMTIMKFSHSGMGQLKITADGIQLSGKAYILDSLVASSIKSRADQPIVLQSSDNITVITVDSKGNLENRLFIDEDQFQSQSSNLIIEDATGKLLFSSNPEEVSIGADKMTIVGTGGAVFDNSIETPLISSVSGQDLRLESLTRSLNIDGPRGISLESSAGGIQASCLKDIEFKTKTGAIKLESSNIVMANLQTAEPALGTRYRSSEKTKIYQVCVCQNGRLFLASPKGLCEIHNAEFLCRS